MSDIDDVFDTELDQTHAEKMISINDHNNNVSKLSQVS